MTIVDYFQLREVFSIQIRSAFSLTVKEPVAQGLLILPHNFFKFVAVKIAYISTPKIIL